MCHNRCITLVCRGPEHQVWLVAHHQWGQDRTVSRGAQGQREGLRSVSWLLASLMAWARMGWPLGACGLPSDFGGAQLAAPQQQGCPLLLMLAGRGGGTDWLSPELPGAEVSFQQHCTLWPEGDYISGRNRIFKINSELK